MKSRLAQDPAEEGLRSDGYLCASVKVTAVVVGASAPDDLRNLSSTDFHTASKTALSALHPSHTAGIAPLATAPTIPGYVTLR